MQGITSAQLNYLKAKAFHDAVYSEYLERTKNLNFDEDFDKAFWKSEKIREELNLSEAERELTEAEEELIKLLKEKVQNLPGYDDTIEKAFNARHLLNIRKELVGLALNLRDE
ncbi:hypothetical protein [Carboxydothermus ferrireducens]|uniref:HAD superfamily Cof-like phosphohydrolase n=1 Tax=Carboxydothermus ferrireducens DSM 11255 TaxID=1119529 RepID=A0ABX2R7P7_9THEO|nr:hypothetical protein [Carboxydothermus ferrireducens]NYE57196.1 putative HAD superfamily Cof-like phosphohydrolase [Carboxydothermus ferrireducens DSM 11255]